MDKVKPTEAAWVKEEVKKSFSDAARQDVVSGSLPVTSSMIKEQIQHNTLEGSCRILNPNQLMTGKKI